MPEIRQIVGQRFDRFFTVDKRAIDVENRTVELAFSSETPVERWFGYEILDHNTNSVRLDRLFNAAPLLLQHDADDQIGVIEIVTIDSDRVGRAVVRFSRSALGEEIFQDVIDGIRQNVSVGYMIHEAILEEHKDGVDTYRVMDWEPMEISIVSIPADTSVGVGREFETIKNEVKRMDNEELIDTVAVEENAQPTGDVERSANGSRIAIDSRIRQIGAHFNMQREAEDYIQLGSTVEEFQATVRQHNAERLKTVPSAPRVEVNIPRRSGKMKAFENTRSGEEQAYRSGMWALATIFGDMEAQRWCKDYGVRVMTGTSGTTTSVVPEELILPIVDLRQEYGVARRYCYVHPMASDTAIVPRRKAGVTAYFPGRTEATTESDAQFDDIQLVSRELSALTRLSNAYMADSAINLGDHIASEMAYAFAVKEDDCLFNGDGSSTYGGILGIRPKILTLAGAVNAVAGHDTFAEIDHDDLVSVIGALPNYPGIMAKWFASKRADALVFKALKAAAGGNTVQSLGGPIVNEYLGDEVVISQAMPQVVTTLASSAMLVYGDLNLGVTLGDRAGFEIQILREKYAEFRQTGIIATQRVDINVHGVGDATNAGPIVALIGA